MERKQIAEGVWQLQEEGTLCTNAYLLESGGGKRLLVDTGCGNLDFDFTPDICILTHGHFDHTGGVEKEWKRVYLHVKEFGFQGAYIRIPKNAKKIDFDVLSFPPFSLEIIHTPGHTPGSICIFERKNGILFSGDTKFAGEGVGRTDLGGSEEEIEESLKKIEGIPYKLLCPGHNECEERE